MTLKDGKPCKTCGTSAWYAHGGCIYCAKKRSRKFYNDNKERQKELSREWYQNNKERANDNSRKWAEENPEKSKKIKRKSKRKHKEKNKQANRNYYHKNKNKISKYRYRWNKENKIKRQAHSAVWNAIKNGKLIPAKELECANCGNDAHEYHHWSYKKEHWLDVIPLCCSCHKLEHVK